GDASEEEVRKAIVAAARNGSKTGAGTIYYTTRNEGLLGEQATQVIRDWEHHAKPPFRNTPSNLISFYNALMRHFMAKEAEREEAEPQTIADNDDSSIPQ